MIARYGVLVGVVLSGACSMEISVGGEGRPCSPDTPCGPNTTCIDNRCVAASTPDDHGLSDSPKDGGKQPDTAPDAPLLDGALDTAGPDISKSDSKVVCDAGAHPVTGSCLFRPSNTKTLVYPPGAVAKLSLTTGNTTFNTSTGEITGGNGAVLRAAGIGTKSGIGFSHVSQGAPAPVIGVFQLQSLSVSQGATLRGVGDNALMLWVAGDVSVSGLVDVKASKIQGGPGGGSGSIGGASGPGGGSAIAISGCDVGGGGGGFGAVGGTGGAEEGSNSACNVNSAGGGVYGNGDLVPLYGGSAGASGVNGTTPKGGGGGGGGALQIAVGGSFTLLAAGAIDAGGGGGPGAVNGGGGGGSGGGILIEATTVALGGVVAANGGGGGGGGDASSTGTDGSDALASTTAAPGGVGKAETGLGTGNGGSGGALSAAAQSGALGDSGGGGGGAVGRIAIRSASGSTSGTPTISPAPVKGKLPP